jgi:hypothetical protein
MGYNLTSKEKLLFIVVFTGLGTSITLFGAFSIMAYAQNTNSTNGTGTGTGGTGTTENFTAMISGIIGAVVSFIIAITALLKVLPLPKQIGTAAVMGADGAHAVMDNRQNIVDLAEAVKEIAALIDPERTQQAVNKITPVVNNATNKLNEFTPKVQKLESIASKIGQRGENTTDEIKDMADIIPENIVPTSVKED